MILRSIKTGRRHTRNYFVLVLVATLLLTNLQNVGSLGINGSTGPGAQSSDSGILSESQYYFQTKDFERSTPDVPICMEIGSFGTTSMSSYSKLSHGSIVPNCGGGGGTYYYYSITGKVVDQFGLTLSGVTISTGYTSTSTDYFGVFSTTVSILDGPSTKSFSVTASKSGYLSDTKTVSVSRGGSNSVSLAVKLIQFTNEGGYFYRPAVFDLTTNVYGEQIISSSTIRVGDLGDVSGRYTGDSDLALKIYVQAQSDPEMDDYSAGPCQSGRHTRIDYIKISIHGTKPAGAIPGDDIDGAGIESPYYITDFAETNPQDDGLSVLYTKTLDYVADKIPYGLGEVVKIVAGIQTTDDDFSAGISGNTAYWSWDYGYSHLLWYEDSFAHDALSVKLEFSPAIGTESGLYVFNVNYEVHTIIQELIICPFPLPTDSNVLPGETISFSDTFFLIRP